MNKEKFKEKIKKQKKERIYKNILRFFYFILIIGGTFLILNYLILKENTNNSIIVLLIAILCPIVLILLSILFPKVLLLISNNLKGIKSKDLYREIEEKYTPAIASYLLDKKTESNKDILATILDLNVRNYLKIENNDDFNIIINDKEIDDLYLHEQYIINQIKNNELINMEEFIKKVEDDCKKEKLIVEKPTTPLTIISGSVSILLALILSETDEMNETLYYVLFFIWIISTICFFYKLTYKRTKMGNEVAYKYKGLKNYLKKYTLVKTRDLEYINILDRYLTYALALGEADTIEKLYVPYNSLISKYIMQ